jgi:hypothetical protein
LANPAPGQQDGDMTSSVRFGWWPILHLVVALSAIAQGVIFVLVWAANLAFAQDPEGGEVIVSAMVALGWVEIGLAGVVVIGLAVGAWLHRPLWARGVASVILGMVLHWGWWLLDRKVDVFGTWNVEVADLAVRLERRLWTMLAVDVAAVVALVLGGLLLLWHRPRREPEFFPADEDASAPSEDLPVGQPTPDRGE